MKGRDAIQRRMKFRVTQRVFAKAFSFNRKANVDRATNIKRRRSITLSCDDLSQFSTSVLIVPSVQRLTASSPPLAILDRINGSKNLPSGYPLSSSKTLTLASSAPPMVQISGSPFQNKKVHKRLTGKPKNECKSEAKCLTSAWERRQPSSLNAKDYPPWLRQSCSLAEGSRVVDITITDSSNSELLPPDISPANKFVPIGHEEDDDGISFASGDYDIFPQPDSVGECNHQKSRVDNTSMDDYSDDIIHDKYSVSLEEEAYLPIDLPPSPLSTEGTSSWSRESYVSVRGKDEHRVQYPNSSFHAAKSCDQTNKDWFPNVKQEIMKLASCFTQCGATTKSTL